ncbi:MAG: hypothetical protein WC293_03065 [Candidatus Omnitrophota bacterium]|jgi:hypothetical protein|nr:hypothetical protein [Candidatus Omnitrophota bacterium]
MVNKKPGITQGYAGTGDKKTLKGDLRVHPFGSPSNLYVMAR